MTKKELVEKVSELGDYNLRESNEIVESVLELLKKTLVEGEGVKIHGFGNFVVKQKAARRGRNPQTGEDIIIGPKKILSFKPSQSLRKSINVE